MKHFINQFLSILDKEDKRAFITFVLLLFISGLLSSLSIGTVLPVVHLLMYPDSVQRYVWLNQFTYHQILVTAISLLIAAFWLKNMAALWVLNKQSNFLYNLAAKIRKKLFACYMHQPYIWHLDRNTPTLISIINNEINIFTRNTVTPLGSLLTEITTSISVFAVLVYINPLITISLGCVLGVTLYGMMRFTRSRMKYYSQRRSQTAAKLNQQVIQGLNGIKETKLYGKERFFLDQFNHNADDNASSEAFFNVFQQSFRLFIETAAITFVLGFLIMLTALGYSGQNLLVLLSVFGVASVQLLPSINRLMQAVGQFKFGLPALDFIYNELSSAEHFSGPNRSRSAQSLTFQKQITLDNISYQYEPGNFVVKGINMTIRRGEKVALVGESGAGKSTLADLIMGILTPTHGQITVDGIPINRDNLAAWQRHFGYIPQMIYLYDTSVRENIAFGLPKEMIDDAQVWSCLEAASLSQFVQSLDHGLDSMIGENGIRLSGGQRQRIGIARALYNNPDILVMDEATAALDNQTEQEVTQAIEAVSKSRTMITIAHRITTIRNHDTIYMLERGELIARGDYETLITENERFRAMAQVIDAQSTAYSEQR